MSVPKVGLAIGKCSRCGKTYTRKRPAFPIICDCYKICPLCGREMTPFSPDLTPSTYGAAEQEWSIETLMVCLNHTPPYYSKDLPVEVRLK